MKPAKRYASPASAVPDILIIRALENRFGNLVPYQHRYCLLWCAHVATHSGFLKVPTFALLISDDRFVEHIVCYPDNECMSRSSLYLLKCTCSKNVSFHIIKVCLNLIGIWNKWLAMRERSILNNRKHMRKLNIRNSRTSGACWATLDEICLLSEKMPRRTQDSNKIASKNSRLKQWSFP